MLRIICKGELDHIGHMNQQYVVIKEIDLCMCVHASVCVCLCVCGLELNL